MNRDIDSGAPKPGVYMKQDGPISVVDEVYRVTIWEGMSETARKRMLLAGWTFVVLAFPTLALIIFLELAHT